MKLGEHYFIRYIRQNTTSIRNISFITNFIANKNKGKIILKIKNLHVSIAIQNGGLTYIEESNECNGLFEMTCHDMTWYVIQRHKPPI